MIRANIPAILSSDLSGGTRTGACSMFEDATYILCVDGRCGTSAKRSMTRLNKRNKKKILLLTHPHYDHYYGIEYDIDNNSKAHTLICPDPASYNKSYSSECRGNVEALERIIKKAKAKGISVVYATDGKTFTYGDIKFTVYRDQPSSARNTETYINQGSLCVWFPTIKVLYTGDTGAYCVEEHGLDPVFVGGFHHGNWLSLAHAKLLKDRGCRFYWDDDYSTSTTSFLSTGRGNAIKAGLKVLGVRGDINLIAYSGKTVVYKGTEHWSYKCSYKGKSTLKSANLSAVKGVLKGTYGTGDARITALLDAQYAPSSVQNQVNEMISLVKG